MYVNSNQGLALKAFVVPVVVCTVSSFSDYVSATGSDICVCLRVVVDMR